MRDWLPIRKVNAALLAAVAVAVLQWVVGLDVPAPWDALVAAVVPVVVAYLTPNASTPPGGAPAQPL